ncbi:MAG: hypothetical protein RIC55_19185 [Pirellulaceae bacterium]
MNELPHEGQPNSEDNPNSPAGPDKFAILETTRKLHRLLASLPADADYAFHARIDGDRAVIWECGSTPGYALRVLEEISVGYQTGRQVGDEINFKVRAASEPSPSSVADADNRRLNELVDDLTRIGGLHLALAWRFPGDAHYHFRAVNHSVESAFNAFAEEMSQTAECVLDLT